MQCFHAAHGSVLLSADYIEYYILYQAMTQLHMKDHLLQIYVFI